MIILQDSQIKKIFHNGDEVKKILDSYGNIVFQKTAEMTNDIKFHTKSSVDGVNYFKVFYTDSTQNDMKYSEPNKEYVFPIPTDKTVREISFSTSYIDDVTVSCKIKLSNSLFNNKPSTIRLLNCDATESKDITQSFKFMDSPQKLLEIRNLDARNATRMSNLFEYSNNIQQIVMRDLNVSKVTDMVGMFNKCSGATSIDIANWDTSSVTNLSSAFYYCNKVTALDLSSWTTSNVTDMSSMFNWCSNLTSLDLSGWDMTNVIHMSGMFSYCSSLTSLDLSGCNASRVRYMDYMFDGCSSLISINLSGWNTTNVYKLGWMFRGCSSLTSLDLSGWDISSVNSNKMTSMFYNCKALKTIYMRGCNKRTIYNINYILGESNVSNVTIVTGDVPMTNYIKFTTSPSVASENNVQVTYADSTQDTVSYSEPNKEYSLSIPTDKVVTKIDFDNTMVDEVKVSCKVNLSNTFFTNKPKTIRLLNCDATSSTSLANLFSGVTDIETIEMKDSDFSNVNSMSSMFYNCSAATTIGIANCNTSKIINMDYMFAFCTNLTSLDLSGCDMTKVTSMHSMFGLCKKLKTIRMIGCNKTTIDKVKSALTDAGILNNVTIVTA